MLMRNGPLTAITSECRCCGNRGITRESNYTSQPTACVSDAQGALPTRVRHMTGRLFMRRSRLVRQVLVLPRPPRLGFDVRGLPCFESYPNRAVELAQDERCEELEQLFSLFHATSSFRTRSAFCPVNSSHRWTMTSAYRQSISIRNARLPVCSHAMSVDPLPPNRSSTFSPGLLEY